jgi:hypothetical protein
VHTLWVRQARRQHTERWGLAGYFVGYVGSAWVATTTVGQALITALE